MIILLTGDLLYHHNRFDGGEDLPIFLAINGIVFDVSEGRRFYGKGNTYNVFAGKVRVTVVCTVSFSINIEHCCMQIIISNLYEY